MANSIDTLITNATNRAAGYAAIVDNLVFELRGFINGLPPIAINTSDLDLSKFQYPPYVAPPKDTSPLPVYEPPTAQLPTAPVLAPVGSVSAPPERIAPVINTDGLFQQIAPSPNLPDFDESEPDLNIDGLVSEMAAIAAPVINDFDFPELHESSVGATPILNLPEFDAPPAPDSIRDPDDYAQIFQDAYDRMVPEMQAFIDDKVSTWVTAYAPEYSTWVNQVSEKISGAFEGGVLPDQFESAMFTRARGRVEKEFTAAETGALTTFSKSGHFEPPGLLVSEVFIARLKGAGALADQSTDIYIERRKSEVQHLQFALNLASSQISSVRGTAISYVQAVGQTIQTAASYANSISGKVEKVFEHLIARAQLAVSIMGALNARYEIQLKAALSALDGYKLELEAEQARTQLDIAKINAIEAKIRGETTKVQRYSSLIDAVVKKGSLEELKLKGYGIRADIFKTTTQAKISGFDVYRAAIQGDQAKLEGELTKLKVYDSQLTSDNIRLDANVKQITAVQASNNAKTEVFKSGAEVYRLDSETALTRFQAHADVKKLAQSVYGQELANAIKEFEVGIEIPKLTMEAVIKQYELRLNSLVKIAELETERLKISEHASVSAVGAYQGLASAALGSLNTVASSAIQAVS